MKNIIFVALAIVFIVAIVLKPIAADYKAERAEKEMASFKDDVRRLMNEMDNAGDLPKYMDDKHFQHIYYYTHNLEDNYGKE